MRNTSAITRHPKLDLILKIKRSYLHGSYSSSFYFAKIMKKLKQWYLSHLDLLATVFGGIAGIAQLAVASEYISRKDGSFIGGLALIAWGIVTNKKTPINFQQSFSHLGVSTYQNIDPEMVDAMNQQLPNRRMRELTRGSQEDSGSGSHNQPADDRSGGKSSLMGDRVNPLDREGGIQNPDSK